MKWKMKMFIVIPIFFFSLSIVDLNFSVLLQLLFVLSFFL